MSDINGKIALLVELKVLDEKANRFHMGLNQIPEELQALHLKQKTLEEAYQCARGKLSDTEKALRSSEQELKAKEDELFRAEGKMMEVKTNEEYQAAQRENQAKKDAKGVLEEKVLQLMDAAEGFRQELKGVEKEFTEQKTLITSEIKKLEAQKIQLEKDVQQANEERSRRANELDPTTQATYKKLFSQGMRIAIAEAVNGNCSGCNMQVRPQIYNEVIGLVAIHSCGQCKRILIPSQKESPIPLESTTTLPSRH